MSKDEIILGVGLLILITIFMLMTFAGNKMTEDTKRICWERGLINKEGYKNTKWAGMDFYKSCLMNATCNNPYQKCEVQND